MIDLQVFLHEYVRSAATMVLLFEQLQHVHPLYINLFNKKGMGFGYSPKPDFSLKVGQVHKVSFQIYTKTYLKGTVNVQYVIQIHQYTTPK